MNKITNTVNMIIFFSMVFFTGMAFGYAWAYKAFS